MTAAWICGPGCLNEMQANHLWLFVFIEMAADYVLNVGVKFLKIVRTLSIDSPSALAV